MSTKPPITVVSKEDLQKFEEEFKKRLRLLIQKVGERIKKDDLAKILEEPDIKSVIEGLAKKTIDLKYIKTIITQYLSNNPITVGNYDITKLEQEIRNAMTINPATQTIIDQEKTDYTKLKKKQQDLEQRIQEYF